MLEVVKKTLSLPSIPPLLIPTMPEQHIRGHGVVELRRERDGKLQHRQPFENFVSKAYSDGMKFLARRQTRAGQESSWLNGYGKDYGPSVTALFGGIILSDSTKTEDPDNEWAVPGLVIGWATGLYAGGDTKRGTRTDQESGLSRTRTTWVYDWVTGAGNGTFQSICLCAPPSFVDATAPYGVYIVPLGDPQASAWQVSTNTQYLGFCCPVAVDTGEFYAVWKGTAPATTSEIRKYSTPFEGSDTNTDYVVVVPNANMGAVNPAPEMICQDGSELFAKADASTTVRVYTISTGALARSVTLPSQVGSGGYIWIDKNGDLYGSKDDATAVYKLNKTTLAVTATITLDTSVFPSGLPGVGLKEYVLDLRSNIVWSFRGFGFDPVTGEGYRAYYTNNNLTSAWMHGIMGDGRIFTFSYAGQYYYNVTDRANLGTRTLLGSPVTKVNTQTMKITYQLDYT